MTKCVAPWLEGERVAELPDMVFWNGWAFQKRLSSGKPVGVGVGMQGRSSTMSNSTQMLAREASKKGTTNSHFHLMPKQA